LFSVYLATIVLTVTSARVRFALVPLLLPFAAHAVSRWMRAARDPRRMLWPGVATLAAAAFVLVPVLPAELRQRDFDERDYNLAAVWVRAGEHVDRAEAIARDLDRRHPGSARLQTMLAEIENRRGRDLLDRAALTPEERRRGQELITSALARLRDANAGARAQERFRIHFLAGSIQQYLGQWESAERHYRAALEFDPEDQDLLRRMAVVLANGAMQREPGPERSAALRRAEDILVEILARQPSPELDQLLGRIRANL
jgi:tetratricopeptide (TPR) repeat protein